MYVLMSDKQRNRHYYKNRDYSLDLKRYYYHMETLDARKNKIEKQKQKEKEELEILKTKQKILKVPDKAFLDKIVFYF